MSLIKFRAWINMFGLLQQIAAIKANTRQDIPTINRALKLYKNLLAYGMTDKDIDEFIHKSAQEWARSQK